MFHTNPLHEQVLQSVGWEARSGHPYWLEEGQQPIDWWALLPSTHCPPTHGYRLLHSQWENKCLQFLLPTAMRKKKHHDMCSSKYWNIQENSGWWEQKRNTRFLLSISTEQSAVRFMPEQAINVSAVSLKQLCTRYDNTILRTSLSLTFCAAPDRTGSMTPSSFHIKLHFFLDQQHQDINLVIELNWWQAQRSYLIVFVCSDSDSSCRNLQIRELKCCPDFAN